LLLSTGRPVEVGAFALVSILVSSSRRSGSLSDRAHSSFWSACWARWSHDGLHPLPDRGRRPQRPPRAGRGRRCRGAPGHGRRRRRRPRPTSRVGTGDRRRPDRPHHRPGPCDRDLDHTGRPSGGVRLRVAGRSRLRHRVPVDPVVTRAPPTHAGIRTAVDSSTSRCSWRDPKRSQAR
jgi:hypothetical protein